VESTEKIIAPPLLSLAAVRRWHYRAMNIHEILGMFFHEYLKLKRRSAIWVRFKIVLYGILLNFKAWNTVLDTYD
jgi:hypothetical protein